MNICPRCNEPNLHEVDVMNALSRIDNETYICSDCGRDEAIAEMKDSLMTSIEVDCLICKQVHTIEMTESQKERLLNMKESYEFIQDILPNHSLGERELLISQFCSDCFDSL